jgi:hypothetical protein
MKNVVGHVMIGNKYYHLLPSLVQSTNPFIIMVLHFNDIMHQKVHFVNQHTDQNILGYLSSMIAHVALQLVALSVMT